MNQRQKSTNTRAEPREEARLARRRRIAWGLAALLFYAGAVAWLTWPLPREVASALPETGRACRFDSLLVGWALAHESRTLVFAPASLPHGNAYHPTHYSLLYGEAGFGALPYFLPVFLLTDNPTLALNTTYLASVVLTAWTLHLVVSWWTGSLLASLIAGWTFLMTRWVLWTWAPCAPNYAVLQYLPLIVALAAEPLRRLSHTLRLAGLVALQCLTSVYVAAATFAPLAILALVRLARRSTRPMGARLVASLGLALLVLAPLYGTYLVVRTENPLLTRQSVWYGLPQLTTPLPWGPLGRSKPTAVPVVALLVIALGAASLFVGRWRAASLETRRAWTNAALWLAVGLALSLGPAVTWGERRISLPLDILAAWTPLYEVIRVPYRFGIAGLIGLCLLAGLGFAECMRRVPRHALRGAAAPALALLCGVSMYAEYRYGFGAPPVDGLEPLPASYPIRAPVEDDAELLLALSRSKGPLLELPAPLRGGRPSSPPQAEAMYRSIFHRRPILNGYSGYWPEGFLERMELANRLPDPEALDALEQATGLETVLVHTARLTPADRRRWLDLADTPQPDFRLIARGANGDLLFDVK